jgi:uncharacterized protein YbaP (TraB family)
MDAVLYERARAGEKTIEGLESAQEQVEVFAGMDMDTQVALLRDTVEQLPEMDDLFAELLGAYKERDLARLMEINRITLGAGDKELAAAFMRRVINDRNLRMTERMVPFLKQGDAFVAVGALHLPGSNGILHLLEKRGDLVGATPGLMPATSLGRTRRAALRYSVVTGVRDCGGCRRQCRVRPA